MAHKTKTTTQETSSVQKGFDGMKERANERPYPPYLGRIMEAVKKVGRVVAVVSALAAGAWGLSGCNSLLSPKLQNSRETPINLTTLIPRGDYKEVGYEAIWVVDVVSSSKIIGKDIFSIKTTEDNVTILRKTTTEAVTDDGNVLWAKTILSPYYLSFSFPPNIIEPAEEGFFPSITHFIPANTFPYHPSYQIMYEEASITASGQPGEYIITLSAPSPKWEGGVGDGSPLSIRLINK